MPFNLSFFKELPFGLHVQANALFILQFKKIRGKFIIHFCMEILIAKELMTENKMIQFKILQEYLTSGVEAQQLQGKKIIISLPSSQVRMQSLQVPYGLTENEIAIEIKNNLQQDLPGFSDSLYIDFIEENSIKGYSDIVFFAARENYIQSYIACLKAAGLNVIIVDIDIHALRRVIDYILVSLGFSSHFSSCVVIVKLKTHMYLWVKDKNKIVFQEEWQVHDHDFSTSILHQAQLFFNTFSDISIEAMVFYGILDESLKDSLFHLCEAKHLFEIKESELNQWFPHYPSSPQHSVLHSGFLIACGLAMRESYPW